MPAISRLLVVCSSAVVAAIVLALAQRAGSHAAAAPSGGQTFIVNSTVDAPDADNGDGLCASAANGCTLRAAIQEANYLPDLDTIIVPAGTFTLTRVGDDNTAERGDLDIQQSVTIIGAGPVGTIVQWDPNITSTLRDRVFQIFPSAITTTLSGMTIRNGTSDIGSGIYWTGGASLSLSNVRLENNQAGTGGGGLFVNYALQGGSVSLDHLTLHANQSGAVGGGMEVILHGVRADFALRSSQIYSNSADYGGGIFLVNYSGASTDLSALIADTEFYSNTALSGGGIDNLAGDALHPLQLVDSTLHDNEASTDGGAIYNYGGLSLLRTVVDFNRSGTNGGGLYHQDGTLKLTQSTVSHNATQYGGGIYSFRANANNPQTYLLNSTISANNASHQGGGLYAAGGNIWSNNNTIAANRIDIPLGQTYAALGAGILLTASSTFPAALFTTTNTILADNVTHNPRVGTYADDCYGEVNSLGYNMAVTLTNCPPASSSVGPFYMADPQLGPLQLNGGTSATQALLPGSPAIDAGRPSGCTDAAGAPITIDQRSVPRNDAHCDIGAYEVATNVGQTIDFVPIPNQTLPTPPFGITATASSGLTVTFSTNTPSLCTVSASSLNLLGVSAATVTPLNRGSCTLVAQQPGDATFSAAPPVTRTFNVSAKLFLPLVVR